MAIRNRVVREMGEVGRAVGRAAAAGVGEMPGAYLAALSLGGDQVGLSRVEELQLGPVGLLVLALVRIPDLFLYCHVLEACDLDPAYARLPPAMVVRVRVRVLAGAGLRLAYRALEAHMLTPGEDGLELELTIRLTDAFSQAERLLENTGVGEGSWMLEHAHHGLWALGDAAAAASEPTVTPLAERLVDAIARLLAVFMVVSELPVDERPVLRVAGGA